MRGGTSVRVQVVLVVALALGSLGVMLEVAADAWRLPARERRAREEVAAAAARLAREAVPLANRPEPKKDKDDVPRPMNEHFAELTHRVLRDAAAEAEGGFYFFPSDQFFGFGKPAGGEAEPKRRDPPPRETGFIRGLCRQAIELGPDAPAEVRVREVGPSRVAAAAAAVGGRRPGRVASWVLIRLTGPEELQREAARYRTSVWLALGGIGASLALAANLMRTARRDRRERERLREELRRAEQLATLGRMLAGVAHEVRTPLAGLRSTVQLWERLPDRARTPESLAAVVGAVDRLNELVSRLLLFARSGQEARRPVDLNALVAETFELVRAQAAGQGVTLVHESAAGLPPIRGADHALRQVVLNLVANALQAMPAGGTLTCRTRAVPGGVELTVSDTGPGVPAADRGRLFEPFFTTRADGTGLGLALCREIVGQHGGRIELADGPGPGAAFRVTLPANGGEPT